MTSHNSAVTVRLKGATHLEKQLKSLLFSWLPPPFPKKTSHIRAPFGKKRNQTILWFHGSNTWPKYKSPPFLHQSVSFFRGEKFYFFTVKNGRELFWGPLIHECFNGNVANGFLPLKYGKTCSIFWKKYPKKSNWEGTLSLPQKQMLKDQKREKKKVFSRRSMASSAHVKIGKSVLFSLAAWKEKV